MHPLQSARIDNEKREKKQCCIQFVEMARPNLFSRCGGVGQSTQHKGTLASRIPKRVLPRMTNKILEPRYFAGTCSANCGASEAIAFDSAGSAAPFRTIASS